MSIVPSTTRIEFGSILASASAAEVMRSAADGGEREGGLAMLGDDRQQAPRLGPDGGELVVGLVERSPGRGEVGGRSGDVAVVQRREAGVGLAVGLLQRCAAGETGDEHADRGGQRQPTDDGDAGPDLAPARTRSAQQAARRGAPAGCRRRSAPCSRRTPPAPRRANTCTASRARQRANPGEVPAAGADRRGQDGAAQRNGDQQRSISRGGGDAAGDAQRPPRCGCGSSGDEGGEHGDEDDVHGARSGRRRAGERGEDA